MNPDELTTDDLILIGISLSIHRASIRRKLDRLKVTSRDYGVAVAQLNHLDQLLPRINGADTDRLVSPGK
jgi:hypothetical protein